MAKVKLNDGQFTVIQENIDKAKEAMTDAINNIWKTNFENLSHNFITNGFLDDLYKDAESNYHKIAGISGVGLGVTGTAASAGLGYAASSLAAGTTAHTVLAAIPVIGSIPVAGWVIAGIICVVLIGIGIRHLIVSRSDPSWKYEAKTIFENLLNECVSCSNVNYQASYNLNTKLQNCRLSLQAVLVAIADFNAEYANLSESANNVGLGDKLQFADDDGLTVTNINTTINVDGQEVQTTISEALNAFYTYTASVTAAEIEAEYLHQKYPDVDINFLDIVKNGNAFILDTLDSGLYTKEFIDTVLPSYTANLDEAKDSVSKTSKFSLDTLEDLLNKGKGLLGDIGLYAGLIGTPFIPADNFPADIKISDGDTTGTQPEETPKADDVSETPRDDSSTGSSTRGGTCGSCGNSGTTSGSTSSSTPSTTPSTKPEKTPKTSPETEPKTTPEENTVEIEPIDETKIPEEEYKFEYGMGDNIDYDKLAREQYEFGQAAEEINKHQQELLEEIEKAYESGNLDSIRSILAEYGFSTPEIEKIVADKALCIKTLMYCDKRELLAAKAKELALADGVKDYDTKYDDKINYDTELSGDGPNDLLMLASEDENCKKAYDDMNVAKEAYKNAIETANPSIKKVNESKKSMEELKAKFEKEFKSEDTTKWSEDAANQYNSAIRTYNDSVKEAATQMAAVEAAKNVYVDKRNIFENAEKTYYDQIKADHAAAQQQQQQQQDTNATTEDTTHAVESNDNNNNESSSANDDNKPTELHTNNVVVDSNGDIVFDMNNTGEVQGATLDTSSVAINDPAVDTSKDTLSTDDINGLIS